MAEVNIVVVESPKKARRFTENFNNYIEKHPEQKNKYFFISTGGSINDVNFPKNDKLRDVNFPDKDIKIDIIQNKKDKLNFQLKNIVNKTLNVRDWRSEKVNFIIASDPDREGAGIAKGVTKYLNDLESIDSIKIVKAPFKYMDIESYSFKRLHDRIASGDYKKNYDTDLGNQQVMRSAIDKFLGFSSADWTSNKVKFSTGRIKRPLLHLVKEGEYKETKDKETDAINVDYTIKGIQDGDSDSVFTRSFLLKDPIKKEIIETQPFLVKYEEPQKNHSYVPNLAELLVIVASRMNLSMKQVYNCVEKLYLGVRLKYTSGDNEEIDIIQSLISYPRTDSKIINQPREALRNQENLINDHLGKTSDPVLTQEFENRKPRDFKNVNDTKKYPYIQKGHEGLTPNYLQISPFFLGATLYSDGSDEMNKTNIDISQTYMALRDQVFCTYFSAPRAKELKLYYRDEDGKEVNVPLLVPETTANKDALPIEKIVGKTPLSLTSELSLFKQMLKYNLTRPSTYHQITNNLDSFKNPKFNYQPLVIENDNSKTTTNSITEQGKQLLTETSKNPYFNIKYTKTMEDELKKLKNIKNDGELKVKIASKLSDINNNVNKTLPKEIKENKRYNTYQKQPSKEFSH